MLTLRKKDGDCCVVFVALVPNKLIDRAFVTVADLRYVLDRSDTHNGVRADRSFMPN
jgi:hypothetical protein